MCSRLIVAALLVGCAAGPLFAQGRTDYLNIESRVGRPLDIARIGGRDYLLVCNTPNNSVEVYDTNEALPVNQRFLFAVKVGLEPVCVRYSEATGHAYTANFLGDSVSCFRLEPQGQTLKATFVATQFVGDEPMDIELHQILGEDMLYVTLTTAGSVQLLREISLTPLFPGQPAARPLVDDVAMQAIKDPRSIRVHDDKVYVLGWKGGRTNGLPADFAYDFDLFVGDETVTFTKQLGGLGTTNWGMEFSANGDLYVVGAFANFDLPDEPSVQAAPTGFVETHLWVVQNVDSANPTIFDRNLNDVDGNDVPVAFNDALAQVTDVALYEPAGGPLKVFLCAFSSDRIGVIEPSFGHAPPALLPYTWPIRRMNVSAPAVPGSTPFLGPRGMVLKPANPSDPLDPGARLYVLTRNDNAVALIDPDAEQQVGRIGLRHDPTPDYIKDGRPFLYSAFFSRSGFVSCSSCHIDARTDVLPWKLGNGTPNTAFPAILLDGPPNLVDGNNAIEFCLLDQFAIIGFPPDKEIMITQSLQGLINFEVDPASTGFVTNAPYHWRGDRSTFADFNRAFVDLLDRPNLNPNQGEPAKGLTDEQMITFEDFINSIVYPPNPREPSDRVLSGDFNLDTGAQFGMKLFHEQPLPICLGQSCVHCHALGEGSDNRITEITPDFNPIETAALRGLFQKEALRETSGFTNSDVVTGIRGMAHEGTARSINDFVENAFSSLSDIQADSVIQFVREMDWGVAPIVRSVVTVDMTNTQDPVVVDAIALMEEQARKAYSGAVVHVWISGALSGYYADPQASGMGAMMYRNVNSGMFKSVAQLEGLLVDAEDRLVWEAVPLGSERRIARPNGNPSVLTGPPPAMVTLEPMRPISLYADVLQLSGNYDPNAASNPFVWTGTTGVCDVPGCMTGNMCEPPPPGMTSQRLLQYAQIQDGMGAFGVTSLRHEPPRRLVVAGENIRHGATLHLFVPNDVSGPPGPTADFDAFPTKSLIVKLHATDRVNAEGHPIFESSEEIAPLMSLILLAGGVAAPGVADTLISPIGLVGEPPPIGTYNPLVWNAHGVRIINADGTSADFGWQPLSFE